MTPTQSALPIVLRPARVGRSGAQDRGAFSSEKPSRSTCCMPLFRDSPELLVAFREGRREALETVYRHYVRPLDSYFRALARWAGSAELAQPSVVQDLLQEAFIRAFSDSARHGYDGMREFLPYLRTIARNCFIDQLRKRRHEIPLATDEPPLALEEPPRTDDEYEPEVLAALEAYLRDLPPALKGVYEQRFVLGRSQETACDNLGISRRTLRTHEEHLRRGLRKALRMAGLLRDKRSIAVGELAGSRT
jgi:RNA polymerase sigma factor (sigma-70 family)